MNTLKYKGFIGSVDFSEEDNILFGKIEGIDGLVNFEGSSVNELKSSFHEAVEDYIAYCKEEGIVPQKSYSGTLNIRLSPDIHRKIAILANKAGVSVNAFIKQALNREVATLG